MGGGPPPRRGPPVSRMAVAAVSAGDPPAVLAGVHPGRARLGRISGDLLTSRGGSSGGATSGRVRHVPAGAPKAGYFAAFFLRSAQ